MGAGMQASAKPGVTPIAAPMNMQASENRPGFKTVNGRDHHPFSFSIWMAGGGVKGGQVFGESDEMGWNVAKDPVHVNDFQATLLHLFGIDHEKLTYRYQGRDFRLTDVGGKVVKALVV